MSFPEFDTERILSDSQQWLELNQKWGEPVDLDAPACKEPSGRLTPAASVSALNRTTFDSAKIIEKVKRTKSYNANDSMTDYNQFTENLTSAKEFYFVGGNIFSKMSVEEICRDIDSLFKDFGTIATSTVRAAAAKQSAHAHVVENSHTMSGLSFDDTVAEETKKQSKFSKSLEHAVSYIESLFRAFDAESFHC